MMASAVKPVSGGKRKRGPGDVDGRNVKVQTTNGDHNDFTQMLQGIDNAIVTGTDDNTRTAQAALAAPLAGSTYPDPRSYEPATMPLFDDSSSAASLMATAIQPTFDTHGSPVTAKPVVGSQEWHQQRKDNHKEVERRRREVINEGIEHIAKVVPGSEKNKGAILQRTRHYIVELQQQIAGFEKERATVDVALKELTSRNDRLKESARSAWQESTKWQQRCRDAGLQFDDYDDGLPSLDDDDVTAGLA